MMIMWNALKEKIRRKELYIVSAIGLILLLGFSSGVGTITINGIPITDYENLAPVLMVVIHVICGALAIVLSLRTIPNEYERHTSHLIWIRGIHQSQYHGELALANIGISLISEAILYIGLLIFTFVKGHAEDVWRLIPAFLIMAISIVIISLFTSLLSTMLPSMAAGAIAAFCYLAGVLHGVLETLRNMISGFASGLLRGFLWVVPDLNEIQTQAGNVISGDAIEWHVIWKGLLIIWVLGLCLFLYRKKEA